MSDARRAEIEAKQERVAGLMAEAAVDWLLLLEPANVAWFSGVGLTRGGLEPGEQPCLLVNPHARWLVCSNVDSARLFDTAIDGMGFQLKEWPYAWSREQLLGELVQGKRVAFDRPFRECVSVADQLRRLRLVLTPGEQARLRELGRIVSHALEATCRNVERGQTECEIAGQLAHRLWNRAAEPLLLTAAVDGRTRRCRRPGVGREAVAESCTVMAVAARDGLHLQASRTVCLTPPCAELKAEHEAACRVLAAQAAAGAAGSLPGDAVRAGRKIARVCGAAYEYEWRQHPPGHLTGFRHNEGVLPADGGEPFAPGMAVVWQASMGAALVADTFLVGDEGLAGLTPAEGGWPTKRVKVQGRAIDVPDLLVRG